MTNAPRKLLDDLQAIHTAAWHGWDEWPEELQRTVRQAVERANGAIVLHAVRTGLAALEGK